MNLKLETFSGEEQNFTLEHRFLNMVLIAAIIIFFVGNVANYLIGLNKFIIAINIGGNLFFAYMYYLSRLRRNNKIPLLTLAIVLIILIFPASWIANGGTSGGISYFMMLGISLFAIMLNKWKRIATIIGIILMANILVVLEYSYPMSIIGYDDSLAKYVDIAVSLTVSMIVNACLICALVHQYRKEQAKVNLYIAEVGRHKARLERQSFIEKMNIKLKQEIDERIKAQEAKHASDEKFLRAFDASAVPMCILATKPLRFVEINTSTVETFGYDRVDFSGTKAKIRETLMTQKQYRAILRELREQGAINKMETTCYNRYGTVLNGLLSVEKLDIAGECFWICVWCDITQLQNMEMELKRLDRLHLAGQMAAGLAHEIRNPMTTVRGFLQLMARREPKYGDYFKLMIEELDKANAIITEFLFMAKDRVTDFQLKDINKIIKNVMPLVEADAAEEGHCVTFQSGQIPMILVDENQIRQMLLNLIRNGIEAMIAKGKLSIRTYVEGAAVVLAISDEGAGIDTEIMKHLGTPFFTTKQEGTGLGLAICYSIAARHGADINIDTSNKGSTFHIKFKVAAG